MRNPISVIRSCETIEQVGVAQVWGLLWLRRHGVNLKGEIAKVVFARTNVRVAELIAGYGADQGKSLSSQESATTPTTNVTPIRTTNPR